MSEEIAHARCVACNSGPEDPIILGRKTVLCPTHKAEFFDVFVHDEAYEKFMEGLKSIGKLRRDDE